ncbi:MAG: MFS transporter [Pseudomonadota bacterium]|nr:MFS transporter [Pseudomonadota bacterium]
MNRIARKYVEFLRQPDVARLLLSALLTRMPVGMVSFAMLMFLHETMGNFTLAGSAVGISMVALAACAPIQGRVVDLYGPRRLLAVTAVVQPLALLATLASAKLGLPFAVVTGCAIVSGMFASPITTLTRTVWRHRFDREDDRRTAFALDAVAIEVNFTLGPALVALVLATAGATAAFAMAIGFVVLAMAVFLGSGALRYVTRETGMKRHLLGPLREPGLWLVFVATFGLTLSFGLLEVGYPAYATALALPALGGVLLAINAVGSALGGALYGGLHFRMPVERQFAWAAGLMALPLLLHAVLLDHPIAFGVVAFLAGALIAPSIAAQSVLVSRIAPSHYATEAFTWSSTFIVSGLGTGMALGGVLAESVGLRYAFITGGVVVALVALVALAIPARAAAPAARAAD